MIKKYMRIGKYVAAAFVLFMGCVSLSFMGKKPESGNFGNTNIKTSLIEVNGEFVPVHWDAKSLPKFAGVQLPDRDVFDVAISPPPTSLIVNGAFLPDKPFIARPLGWKINLLYDQCILPTSFPWERTCLSNWDDSDYNDPMEREKDRRNISSAKLIVARNMAILKLLEKVKKSKMRESFEFSDETKDMNLRYQLEFVNGRCFIELSRLVRASVIVQQMENEKNSIDESLFFLDLCKKYIFGKNIGVYSFYSGLIAMRNIHCVIAEVIGKIEDERMLIEMITFLQEADPEYEIALRLFKNQRNKAIDKPLRNAIDNVINEIGIVLKNEVAIKSMPNLANHDLLFFLSAKAQNRMLQLTAALRLYWVKKRKFPMRLEELVPDYIKKIPIDPYSGDCLHYDPMRQMIWSVGSDFINENGNSGVGCSKEYEEPVLRFFWGKSI